MSRKEEIKQSIEYLNKIVEFSTKESLNQTQITNINLSAITSQLADISVTLAIIADKLGGVDDAANDNR